MIEAQSLTRRYGRRTAVTSLSFKVEGNSIVGLLGPNGAGKSTVMRMLSGYLEPSVGTVRINGLDPWRQGNELRRQLGYLPENLPLYPEMMVADYLDYAAAMKGLSRAERPEAIRALIRALDLKPRMLDRIHTLSRGLRQRVGVAQAMLGRPRLLILDEPSNGLDPDQADEMRALIKQLARRATVILSSHIMQEVEAVCDRVLLLNQGRLVLDDSVDRLRRSGALRLRCGGGGDGLEQSLAALPGVAQVEATQGELSGEFTLTLEVGADADRVAQLATGVVVDSGAQLYQLQQLTRGLDTVFRETTGNSAEVHDNGG